MKTKRYLQAAFLGIASLLLASSSGMAQGDFIYSSFDADISAASAGDGAPKTLSWSDLNAGGSGSGSLYAVINWANNTGGWQDSKIQFSSVPWPGVDCTKYVNLEFDVKVDQTNSSPALDGSYGLVQVVCQGWGGANGNPSDGSLNWVPIGAPQIIATNGWQHIVISLVAFPHNVNNLVLNFAGNPPSATTNTISYWIDNVTLTVPPSAPPTMQITAAPSPGLTCIASHNDDTYQRQMIGTVLENYSWNTESAASNTTTYSMTITNFSSDSGFNAQLFLCPHYIGGDSSVTNDAGWPGESALDWNAGDVIVMTVGSNGNGTATADFRYKTNNFGSNTMLQNNQDGGDAGTNGYSKGHIANLTCATGPLGTWSLSFNNNTNVTMTAPDGSVTNFTISAVVADRFKDPLNAFFGIQPNNANIHGQYGTFSRIQILGAGGGLDVNDDFISTGTPGLPYLLDGGIWRKSAADGSGIIITAPDAKKWLTWTTPDPGFSTVYVTDDISKQLANNEWMDMLLSPSSWITVGNKHMTVINQSTLDNAFGYSPTNAFFGLWKVVGP